MKIEVEDFTDLSKVSYDKLIKLRDVANGYYLGLKTESSMALDHYLKILKEIQSREKKDEDI